MISKLVRYGLRKLWWGRFFVLFLFILCAVPTGTVAPEHALWVQIDQATEGHRFDLIDWESEELSGEFQRHWQSWLGDTPLLEPNQGQALVEMFLEREQAVNAVEREIREKYAEGVDATALERQLTDLQSQQEAIIPQVEYILIAQVEEVLRDQGFVYEGQVMPPVAFRMVEPPTFLILSPRDRIDRIENRILAAGLPLRERVEIEAQLDRAHNVSSYVTNIGGLGSYPAMVLRYDYLPFLVNVIIHEWVHNYFFLFPTNMAWGYLNDARLRTINETTADLVAEELSREVIIRFYPNWIKELPEIEPDGQPKPRQGLPWRCATSD